MPILKLTVNTDNVNEVLAALKQLQPYTPKFVGTPKQIRRYANQQRLNINLVMHAAYILSTAVALRWCSLNDVNITSTFSNDRERQALIMKYKDLYNKALETEGRSAFDGYYPQEIDPKFIRLAEDYFPRSGTSAKFLWRYVNFLGLGVSPRARK